MVRTLGPLFGSRPAWIVLGLFSGVMAAGPAPAQAPAQQAQAVSNARMYPNDGAVTLNFIKPDKTADFEAALAKLKEALQKSNKPERQQQAAGWKIFKSPDPAGQNVLYVFVINPSVKGADYQVSNIIAEGFGTGPEINDLLKKYAESYAQGINIVNLNLLHDLSK
jgi:hypothetical protein